MDPVSALMIPEPICVSIDTPVHRCAVLLQRHNIRHLPVVDEEGRLFGVVNDHDVFRRGVLTGGESELWMPFEEESIDDTAADLAQPLQVVVGPDEPLAAVLRALADTVQDAALVIDEERHVLGLLTEHDGLRLAQGLPERAATPRKQALETIPRGLGVSDAFERMVLCGIRHLLIVDHGRLWGVVSMRDLYVARGAMGASTPVEEIWRRPEVLRVSAGTSLRAAAALMLSEHIGCLPIVDAEDHPVGVLTRADLILAVAESLEAGEELG